MSQRNEKQRRQSRSWFGRVTRLVMWSSLGFIAGVISGVVFEEPKLLGLYFAGEAEEVEIQFDDESGQWVEEQPLAEELPPVAAAPPELPPVPSLPINPPEPATEGIFIQVGAFADKEPARRLQLRLQEKKLPVILVLPEDSEDQRWRVRVGPYQQRDAAEKVAKDLKRNERLPTWVMREAG